MKKGVIEKEREREKERNLQINENLAVKDMIYKWEVQ